MYYVQVQVGQITIIQVAGANQKMAIRIAHTHITSKTCKFDPKIYENFLGFLAEDSPDSFDFLETLEVICEGVRHHFSFTQDFDAEFLLYRSFPLNSLLSMYADSSKAYPLALSGIDALLPNPFYTPERRTTVCTA
jgi:hypothetical protein